MEVKNVAIYGLNESIYRSGYAMMDNPPTENEFKENILKISLSLQGDKNNPHIKRAISLANAKGGGHNQFLTGIVVQFDLTFANKTWIEAERYVFLNFITSMSTMHRISKFDIGKMCNSYTSIMAISVVEDLQKTYLSIPDTEEYKEGKKEAYLKLLNNLPSGFEVTAGMTTNYRCLRNIYEQRRYHRLTDWQEFCDWVETLPMAKELIIGNNKRD